MAAYRVLVVEDNHEVRRMVSASIKSLDQEIDVLDVPSAEEALLISASLPLDLVVLDIRLPGMSGLDMVARLRKRRPETKVILVTGIEDAATRKLVSQADVAAYFFKPIEIDAFLEAVKRSLWYAPAMAVSTTPGPAIVVGPGVEPAENVPLPPTAEETVTSQPAAVSSGGKRAPKQLQPLAEASITSQPEVVSSRVRTAPKAFQPTLDERLTALKLQLKAAATLLVDDAGQVVEVAGNPSPVTSVPELLSSLRRLVGASLLVSQAMSGGIAESMHYFSTMRQGLYLAPVGSKHALLVVTSGYFDPDKLGLIDRAIHLTIQDLLVILESSQEDESLAESETDAMLAEPAAEVPIDQDTLAGIEKIFTLAPKEGSSEEVDDFWESMEQSGYLDETTKKDILSFDQAQEMGLTPDEDETP